MLDLLDTIDYRIGQETFGLTNIVTSVILKRLNVDKTFLYQDVLVPFDTTLEQLSNDFYNDSKYWWVIMIVNNIVDPFNGLPMSTDLLVAHTRGKYGDEYGLHWFKDSRTNRICDDLSTKKWKEEYANNNLPEYIIPVSHLDYEQEVNQNKTKMKIVNPTYISVFVEVFKEQLNAE